MVAERGGERADGRGHSDVAGRGGGSWRGVRGEYERVCVRRAQRQQRREASPCVLPVRGPPRAQGPYIRRSRAAAQRSRTRRDGAKSVQAQKSNIAAHIWQLRPSTIRLRIHAFDNEPRWWLETPLRSVMLLLVGAHASVAFCQISVLAPRSPQQRTCAPTPVWRNETLNEIASVGGESASVVAPPG